eukprot:scaffold12549_cov75-Phaeocystis_antarctica.AAC.1
MGLRAGLQGVLAAGLLERDDGHVVHRAGQQHVILYDLGAKGTGVGSSCRVAGHDTGGRGGGARLRERRRLTGSLTACFGAAATAGPRVILNGARRTLPSGAAGAVLHGGGAGGGAGGGRCAPAVSNAHTAHSLVERLADLSRARHRHQLVCQQECGGGVGGAAARRRLGVVLEARGVGDAYRLVISHGLVALVPIGHLRGTGTASFGGGPDQTTAGRETHVLYPQPAGQALPVVARASSTGSAPRPQDTRRAARARREHELPRELFAELSLKAPFWQPDLRKQKSNRVGQLRAKSVRRRGPGMYSYVPRFLARTFRSCLIRPHTPPPPLVR